MAHLGDFPINISIYEGFSMAMLNNQMVWVILPLCSLELHLPEYFVSNNGVAPWESCHWCFQPSIFDTHYTRCNLRKRTCTRPSQCNFNAFLFSEAFLPSLLTGFFPNLREMFVGWDFKGRPGERMIPIEWSFFMDNMNHGKPQEIGVVTIFPDKTPK
jgi:hypothetical protein